MNQITIKPLGLLRFIYFYFYIYVCLLACTSVHRVYAAPVKVRREHRFPETGVRDAMLVLKIEPRSTTKTASVLNH